MYIHICNFPGQYKEIVKENKKKLISSMQSVVEGLEKDVEELEKILLKRKTQNFQIKSYQFEKKEIEKAKSEVEKMQFALSDLSSHFQENEIIIGNYRLRRETAADAWTVSELAQVSSVNVWPSKIRGRWKQRLYFATERSLDFSTVLQNDYKLPVKIAFILALIIIDVLILFALYA